MANICIYINGNNYGTSLTEAPFFGWSCSFIWDNVNFLRGPCPFPHAGFRFQLLVRSQLVTDVTFLHRKRAMHEDVIKWKLFPRCWPFVRGIYRTPVDSLHKASDVERWFFLSAPEQMVQQTIETSLIWEAIALIMRSLRVVMWDII